MSRCRIVTDVLRHNMFRSIKTLALRTGVRYHDPVNLATYGEDLQEQVVAAARMLDRVDLRERDVVAAELLDQLESLKNSIAGVQARLSVALRESRVAQRTHEPAAMRERGIGAEIALARRESPHRGGIHLGLAVVLCSELPHTLAAMEAGRCSEWRATQLAQGTACLTLTDRQAIDEALMADPTTTEGWGDRRFRAEVDRLAYVADPRAAVERNARAAGERHTSLRPAPDGMTRFSALLPLHQGVAVHATLCRAADSARAGGDERSRGQVMADTLIHAVTTRAAVGSASSTAPTDPVVPVAVQVTVSDTTLLNLPGEPGDQPGWLSAPGVAPLPLPADAVRDLIARAHAEGIASLRRLYTHPGDGQLVAMDSQARCFPAGLAGFLVARDRTCTTPYCDAPIRHLDHVRPHARGGATSAANGNGKCEACNHAKEATGWAAEVTSPPTREIETTAPTGRRYRSRAPGLPPPAAAPSRLEVYLAEVVLAA